MKECFVICVKSDDPDLLTPRMIYQVLPDENAAKSRYLRIIDNEGEDYLYPEDFFLHMNFPDDIEHTLLHLSSSSIQQHSLTKRPQRIAA